MLLCGALLSLLSVGVVMADPMDSESVEALPEIDQVSLDETNLDTAESFPILTIEALTPEEPVVTAEPEQPAPVEAAPAPTPVQKTVDHAGVLSTARLFALGMIETGNKDDAVGGLGEVSRYQIMPSVWKAYSESRSYHDVDVATEVARQHWTSLYEYFKKKTERAPTNFDMYVLWNTRYGYYAAKGFEPDRLHPVVRDRAQRFTNLVEDSLRRESELEMAALR